MFHCSICCVCLFQGHWGLTCCGQEERRMEKDGARVLLLLACFNLSIKMLTYIPVTHIRSESDKPLRVSSPLPRSREGSHICVQRSFLSGSIRQGCWEASPPQHERHCLLSREAAGTSGVKESQPFGLESHSPTPIPHPALLQAIVF